MHIKFYRQNKELPGHRGCFQVPPVPSVPIKFSPVFIFPDNVRDESVLPPKNDIINPRNLSLFYPLKTSLFYPRKTISLTPEIRVCFTPEKRVCFTPEIRVCFTPEIRVCYTPEIRPISINFSLFSS